MESILRLALFLYSYDLHFFEILEEHSTTVITSMFSCVCFVYLSMCVLFCFISCFHHILSLGVAFMCHDKSPQFSVYFLTDGWFFCVFCILCEVYVQFLVISHLLLQNLYLYLTFRISLGIFFLQFLNLAPLILSQNLQCCIFTAKCLEVKQHLVSSSMCCSCMVAVVSRYL